MPLHGHVASLLVLTCAVGAPIISHAAPKPLPPLSADEIELRAIVQPLRDGLTTGEDLQPLRDWLEARRAAGQDRGAERELRRVLKRIHDDANRDLLRAAEWVHRLQVQRSKIYTGLVEENAGLERTLEKLNESPPLPDAEELLPGRSEMSDAFLFASGADPDANTRADIDAPDDASADDAVPSMTRVVDTDMDKERLLNRLTLDLTILGHLLHECDNEYEDERDRHRDALEALDAYLKDYRSSGRVGSGPAR